MWMNVLMTSWPTQCNAMSQAELWVSSQWHLISWKIINYYSNLLTFPSTVDLLGQNLLLFVQLLQLCRVQHFAVHLKKRTLSFNHLLSTSRISAYLEDSLSWNALLSQHVIFLWDDHDNNNTVSIQHHHYRSITITQPSPAPVSVDYSSNQVSRMMIWWTILSLCSDRWQVFRSVLWSVCTALWPGQ